MEVIKGDLIELALEGEFDVIIHGCNCQCAMGAGIAKAIKNVFPEAYEADCQTKKGARDKLGSVSFAKVVRNDRTIYIVNAYTQFHWKGTGVKVDYEAIRKSMKSIKEKFTGMRIGYPLIGAGLAGGDWSVISSIIDEELQNEKHKLVQFAT
ncbi:macro domain-containing protein [Motilimonas sp. KMU-193]|uniref:macro domain-containing protein n=1 Tax=Motilimonas sp. KMU-193 TaxID=3388668 RepID=UPI00396B2A31